MRLYKMELYKLCHKKSFVAGFLFVLFIGFFFFYSDVQSQYCCIDDTEYTGFKAIKANRQITEEFRGILTDEKIAQIVEKYGFPSGPPDDYNRLKGNFLNTFVINYASDGYINGRDEYQIATRTVPLADTELGQHYIAAGMDNILEYYEGWKSFDEEYGVLMLGVSILILYIVSIVFSEEEQTSMKSLLFTTQKGPSTDTLAKIAAAFSVSVGVWFLAIFFFLLLYCAVYGTDGLHCIASLLPVGWSDTDLLLLRQPIGTYLALILLVSLLAILELCAITIWVSARCHSSFHAVVAAGICYTLPFLGFALLQSGIALLMICSVRYPLDSVPLTICRYILYLLRALIYSSPVYLLVGQDSLIEINHMSRSGALTHVYIVLTLAAALFPLCTAGAYRRYRRPQKL